MKTKWCISFVLEGDESECQKMMGDLLKIPNKRHLLASRVDPESELGKKLEESEQTLPNHLVVGLFNSQNLATPQRNERRNKRNGGHP